MKRIAQLVLVLIFAVPTTFAQTTTAFRKNYNQAMFDLPGNIVEGLTPNTYVMAGTNMTFLPIYGTVTQLNDTGGINWSFRYSDASIGFQLNDIKKDAGANQYIACGGSESNAAVFMVLDASGTVVIQKKFSINEANGAWFNRVIKASDGGYVAVGYVTGLDPDGGGAEIDFNPINYTDANGDPQTEVIGSPLIVKLDASGNHVWHKVFRYYMGANTPANRIYNDASFVDVVEVSDGYVAVGSYDVNNHLSATNSDGDDATPTDAIILKTTTAGVITYHKQVDNPDSSPTQNSKYFGAVNTTSTGEIIVGGSDNGKELIQKYAGAGGFSQTYSRLFTYPGVSSVADISQIYEVNGGTDIATMSMYIQPLAFTFSNAIHRFNSTATATNFAKRYDFNLISILPRGSKTSDNGYIAMSMTAGGTNYDYHVIKTDPLGETPLTGCPATVFTPTASAGPTTASDPSFNAWSLTPGSNVIAISRTAISPTPSYVCTKTTCVAPLEATTVTATPATICSGQSSSITASGPSSGVSYQVWTAASGGTNLGTTPLSVSPTSTTTYYIQTVSNSDGSCISTTRVPVSVTVNQITTANAGSPQTVCGTTATLAGNTPTTGTGVWTLVSGSGTITNPSSPTSGVTSLGAGANVFEWTISNAPCTPSTSQVTITSVVSPTTSNAGTNQTLCSASATLAGNTPTVGTGTWTLVSGSGTITNPNSPTSTVTGLGLGANVFEWTIANAPCTPSTSQITINVTNGPSVIANASDTSICLGESVTLTGTGTAVSYSWDNGVTNGVSFVPTATQTYTVTGLDASSCSVQDQITVTVNSLPSVTVSGNNNICEGETTILTASGASSYVWNTTEGTISISVTPTTTTTYSVTGTNSFGCEATAQYTVTVSAPPIANISGTSSICFGEFITLTASGGNSYTWSTGETSTSITSSPNDTIIYWVTAHVGSCVDSDTFTVNVTPNPNVAINPNTDITIIQGESIELTASGGTTYNWTPSEGLSCTSCTTTIASPEETTKYCVSTIQNGCVDTTCVTVNVDIVCGELFVPTAFSPNGDGVNDCLSVYNNCIEKMDFKVFSRWGEVVFHSIDVNDCWDGSYKGTSLNTAVFVYKLEATLLNGEEVKLKGNVSLIK
ncbi:MAG: gliding motility-associated C-terminal domain-containing protein [Flavobacteriales bacterium]|nr:gliding motility-associated C-terminal domain-containing protein [Flavobacteriales bacterium]